MQMTLLSFQQAIQQICEQLSLVQHKQYLVHLPLRIPQQNIAIPITLDDIHEDDESFTVTIASVTNARFVHGLTELEVEVTIENNDDVPTLTIADNNPNFSYPTVDAATVTSTCKNSC